MVRCSFPVETYEPQPGATWDEAYVRFVKLLKYSYLDKK
jgi:hypothetical protein